MHLHHRAASVRPLPSRQPLSLAFLLALVLTVPLALAGAVAHAAPARAATAVSVRVQGNHLVDASGAPLRLLGVNRSGTEFACVQGWGLFDGPSDAASVAAIAGWHVNAVRVPLNEDCWLGINGVSSTYGGRAYRTAISAYVARLHAAGLAAVLDLHWNAPGTQKATGQQLMADADHAPAFWRSVATTFKGDPGAVFDLYNEPHGISWSCWRNGCTTSAGWKAAGMQSLVNAVRGTGAKNVVLAGGLNWAGDLSGWLANKPYDSAGQLAASAHLYNFSQCNTSACWDSTVAPVAASVPVVTGEVGENDCAATFVDAYLPWADAHGVSYLGWTWNTWDCGSGPALISSYDGTPTTFGAAVRRHLADSTAVAPVAVAPVSTTSTSTSTSTSGAATSATVYDFEGGTAPWHAETTGATVSSGTPAHSGVRSLAATAPSASASSAVLRVNDGGANTLAASAGGTLTAWVLLPAGAPGSGWTADLELQDSAWGWHAGPRVSLVPGQWTKVTLVPTAATWSGHKGLGVQVVSSQSGQGPLTVYVDQVAQSA
ncbi:MAG: glycoside hydrolase family 5 protein [Motilibacteraceae bacterium]